MLKGIIPKKGSVAFSWLFSYLLILLVPVLVTCITYFITYRVIEDEINQSNSFLFRRIQQKTDGLLNNAYQLSVEIAFNPWVKEILEYHSPLDDTQYYSITKAFEDLKIQKSSKSEIDDFFIYFKNIDIVMSSSTITDSKTFYDANYHKKGITNDYWQDVIEKDYAGEYFTLPGKVIEGKRRNMIVYAKSVPVSFPNRDEISANLFVLADESRFLEEVQGIDLTSRGWTLFIDRNNRVLSSNRMADLPETLSYENLDHYNTAFHTQIDGENVIVSYRNSQIDGLKYVSIIPTKVFLSKTWYVRRLVIISTLICMVLGGITSFLALKRNYNPILKLMESFKLRLGLDYRRDMDEFSFIERAINKTIDEKEKVDLKLFRQKKALRDGLIARLLKGKEDRRIPIAEALSSMEIDFKSEYFAVIVFMIDDINGFCDDKPCKPNNLEDYELAQFIITNITEEMLGQKNTAYIAEVDNILACLVNLRETIPDEGINEVCKIAGEAQRFIANRFKIYFGSAVSSLGNGIESIHRLYSQAQQAMEYKTIMGIEGIVRYENLQETPQGEYYYPLEKEQHIISLIKTGAYDEVMAVIEDIFDKNFEKAFHSIGTTKCLMFNLASTIIKAVNELGAVYGDSFPDQVAIVEKLLKCTSITDLKVQIRKSIKNICDFIGNLNKRRNCKLKDGVYKYVQNHYSDMDLSVSSIAGHFDMHPVYLSNAFKNQTGEGLLEYINKVRISKARELIKRQELTINDVAGLVGYSNTRTFTRMFKKWEYIAPGKYREINFR